MNEAMNYDVVICLDIAWEYGKAVEAVFEKTREYYGELRSYLVKQGMTYGENRVKVVAFGRNVKGEKVLKESRFFKYPVEAGSYKQFLDSLDEPECSSKYANEALEALTAAVHSEWRPAGKKQRQVVFVLTNNPALEFESEDKTEKLNQLKNYMAGEGENNFLSMESCRLCIIGSETYTWELEMSDWENTLLLDQFGSSGSVYLFLVKDGHQKWQSEWSPWWKLDFVFCIDRSYSMKDKIEEVKQYARDFYALCVDEFERAGRSVSQLRIKIIAYGNYRYDEDAMRESVFFVLPEEKRQLDDFLDSISVSENTRAVPGNALEALSLAMESDWASQGCYRKPVILVFTDSEAEPLGACAECPNYPDNMPTSLDELSSRWEVDRGKLDSWRPYLYLIAFVTNAYPWRDMQAWNRYWPVFYKKEDWHLTDIDAYPTFDLLIGD